MSFPNRNFKTKTITIQTIPGTHKEMHSLTNVLRKWNKRCVRRRSNTQTMVQSTKLAIQSTVAEGNGHTADNAMTETTAEANIPKMCDMQHQSPRIRPDLMCKANINLPAALGTTGRRNPTKTQGLDIKLASF